MEWIRKEFTDHKKNSSIDITFLIGQNQFWFKPEEISIPMAIYGDTLLETLAYYSGSILKGHVGFFDLDGKNVFLISTEGINQLDELNLFPWAYDFFSWVKNETGIEAVFSLFKQYHQKEMAAR